MKQKIGIIAAADDEIQPLIAQMRIEKTKEAAMLKLIEGDMAGTIHHRGTLRRRQSECSFSNAAAGR